MIITFPVQICNLALALLGQTSIISLEDSSSKTVDLCNLLYDQSRLEILMTINWIFATREQQLARLDETPYKYKYKYSLPADFLKLITVYESEGYKYELRGRELLTDKESSSIKYVSNVTNVGLLTTDFITVLKLKLAYQLCYILTASVTREGTLLQQYELELAKVKTRESQQKKDMDIPVSNWVSHRTHI